MKKGIVFEVGTTDFSYAIRTLEVAFCYDGQEWEKVKLSNSMEELIDFLESDGMNFRTFLLKN